MARVRGLMGLALVVGCQPTRAESMLGEDWSLPEAETGDSGEPVVEETGGGQETGEGEGEGEGEDENYGQQSDYLFTIDRVIPLDITLPRESVESLNADPYTYVEGSIVIDGDELDDVGVRLGGKLGSYRTLSGKAGFKIDLNRYVDGQRYHGLERIVAKNLVQDASFVHERIAFAVYEAMGVPAPRVGYFWVTVNGKDFGLYANMEAIDDRFLERAYAEPDGNLYDGDYLLSADGSSYTLMDFNARTQDLMDLDEGEDVAHADVHTITDALSHVGRGDFEDVMGGLVDLDHHVRFMAVEFWAGQYDGYSNYTNNYRVYFDPSDGLMRMSPWDHDWAFYDSTPLTPQYGALSIGCYNDETCRARYYAAVTEMCSTVAAMDLEAEIDEATDLLNPYIEADPRKEETTDGAIASQNALRLWIKRRPGILASTYGISCEAPPDGT